MSDLPPFDSDERPLSSLAIDFDGLLKMGEFDLGQRIRRAKAFLYIALAMSDEPQILFAEGGDEYYSESVGARNEKRGKPEDVFVVRLPVTMPNGERVEGETLIEVVELLRTIVNVKLKELGAPSDN